MKSCECGVLMYPVYDMEFTGSEYICPNMICGRNNRQRPLSSVPLQYRKSEEERYLKLPNHLLAEEDRR